MPCLSSLHQSLDTAGTVQYKLKKTDWYNKLNGSGQEPRNRHFEIFKYVRIHPNFASRPVWSEKMFLCCFFLKAGRKDLTNRPEVLSPPPSNCSFRPEKCWIWIHEIWETLCYTAKNSGVGGGGWEERTLGLFVKSFLPAFREKQHRNIFSHHTGRLTKFGWILTYLKISVEMAVTWFLPGAIQMSFISCTIVHIVSSVL